MLASLLRSRAHCVVIALFTVIQTALVLFHLPALLCPLLRTTGIPCAGCGLSRSVSLLLSGHPRQAIYFHAFGPVFAAAGMIFVAGALLPDVARMRLASACERIEQRTHLIPLLLLAFFAYWLYRLLAIGAPYRQLMAR